MGWNNSTDKLKCFGIGQRREEHPGGCFESRQIILAIELNYESKTQNHNDVNASKSCVKQN